MSPNQGASRAYEEDCGHIFNMLRKTVGIGLRHLAGAVRKAAFAIYESEHEKAFDARQQVDGDATLRLDYPLAHDSIVFDLGGFKGQWASDIYSRYRSKIYVFEFVPAFAEKIRKRFTGNPDIVVYPYGLGTEKVEADVQASFPKARTEGGRRLRPRAPIS